MGAHAGVAYVYSDADWGLWYVHLLQGEVLPAVATVHAGVREHPEVVSLDTGTHRPRAVHHVSASDW